MACVARIYPALSESFPLQISLKLSRRRHSALQHTGHRSGSRILIGKTKRQVAGEQQTSELVIQLQRWLQETAAFPVSNDQSNERRNEDCLLFKPLTPMRRAVFSRRNIPAGNRHHHRHIDQRFRYGAVYFLLASFELQSAQPSGLRPGRNTLRPVSLRHDTHAAAATITRTISNWICGVTAAPV